ncbi:S8 family serine peptidase [Ekhidna sp. To15]|uniref:S8 family serine peptidase n=1 Tax=Ekhidna sp. To15 TaxID=3395267 RepID=UPI003F5251D9
MRNSLLIVCLLLFSFKSLSQGEDEISKVNRYFIYFADKAGDNYPYSISNPQEFLTQRSIDRRAKQNIGIDDSDLPVNPSYTQGLRDYGVGVYFTSRWLNGALVNIDTTLLDEVESLDFVDSIAWIADTTRLSNDKTPFESPTEFLDPPSVSGDSDIQLMMLAADQMHAEDIKGQGMIIAVLDNGFTGVDKYVPFQHLWENNQIIATKDFVQNSGNVFQFGSHGTSVFSIIASDFESEDGHLIGIAPEANYILCITEDNQAENTLEEYNWLLGAEFADSLGADVINGSLGYRLFDISSHNYTFEDMDGETTIVSRAAKWAADKGMIVTISAGNEGNKSWRRITPPADAKGVLTVGSANPDFSYSSFSSVGNTADGRIKPDVAAFGAATTVMRGDGTISRGSGTSFASPLIAGFAACIWQLNPERTVNEVITAIKTSAHQAGKPDSLLGNGVPNYTFAKDVRALNVNDILNDKVTFYPNPFNGDTLFLITDGKFREGMSIRIMDPKGSLIFQREFRKSEIKEKMELTIDGSQQGVYFLFLQIGNNQKVVKLVNF